MPDEICPSVAAIDLIGCLLVEKERRLSTRRYELNDWSRKMCGSHVGFFPSDKDSLTHLGYFVYPEDGKDIKNHPWFEGVPWETLHQRRPPFVPRVKTWEDTKYFDEEEVVSDIDSTASEDDYLERLTGITENRTNKIASPSKASRSSHHQPEAQHIIPSVALRSEDLIVGDKCGADNRVAEVGGARWPPVLTPTRLQTDGAIPQAVNGGVHWTKEGIEEPPTTLLALKRKKEQKRPRDKILRDLDCAAVALRMRKNGAFLGYGYRRAKTVNELIDEVMDEDRELVGQHQRYQVVDKQSLIEPEVQHIEDSRDLM